METIGTTVLLPIPRPRDPGIRGEPQTLHKALGALKGHGQQINSTILPIRVQVPKNQPETLNP